MDQRGARSARAGPTHAQLALGLVLTLALVLAGCAETHLVNNPALGERPTVFARLTQMPLIESPAPGGGPLVVLYTGDNGWAPFDRQLAKQFNAAGLPVVGVSTLIYFVKPRRPSGAAADLAALIDHYGRLWNRSEVILIGYSYGGDTLPLITRALPASVRARVRLLVLISPSDYGDLTFRGYSWFDLHTGAARPIEPALKALGGLKVLCIHAEHDPRQACDRTEAPGLARAKIGGNHWYKGHEAEVADMILKAAEPKAASTPAQ
jgi:type IV secretory pathway VirJ component